jgi:hypothetical protein
MPTRAPPAAAYHSGGLLDAGRRDNDAEANVTVLPVVVVDRPAAVLTTFPLPLTGEASSTMPLASLAEATAALAWSPAPTPVNDWRCSAPVPPLVLAVAVGDVPARSATATIDAEGVGVGVGVAEKLDVDVEGGHRNGESSTSHCT